MLPPLTDLEGQPGALGRHARDAISKLQELGMEEDLDKSVTSLINYLQPAARERASLAVALQALTELRDVFEVKEAMEQPSISQLPGRPGTDPMDIRSNGSGTSQGADPARLHHKVNRLPESAAIAADDMRRMSLDGRAQSLGSSWRSIQQVDLSAGSTETTDIGL
mmetsp:Transcript_9554/g.28741  ORF Transcript_9554/g.28741 Transcript_9554/m.28741 type:complete len:166 (-) Transcript_9554:369-866(-)|eukprot:CAMPEP_0206142598 /NCGR_PEP_ID=MMETSP1473-20131121/17537_1 /ASSEMBLY_ACC=CAM_ASM_001109 /TAXON_ID=1461547 /ORGANISM="Stichococcus sp, Strain RCC1054" /LENGTH=165 /DNA_ID=CAMNT_0053537651 /DNA_START=150 /DNA_END=647 /DNA_ORIENTATION=-